jgi:predicted nucleotidyltransferase
MHPLRVTRKRLEKTIVEAEVGRVSGVIHERIAPKQLYLFGSAAEGVATDQSDLDFLIVMPDLASIRPAQKRLYPLMPLSSMQVDLVWVTEEIFERKKELGGVCMVAFTEGRKI